MMILNNKQIHPILARLKWEPVYEDDRMVLAKKRSGGYGDGEIGKIEAALSILLELNARRGTT